MSTFLKEVDIKSLIAMETTIDGKTQMLESIINFGLDSLIPFTTKTIYSNEPPWMSKSLNDQGKGGGVAMFVKDNITFKRRKDLEKSVPESLMIEIGLKNSKPFLVGCFYRPPETSRYSSESYNSSLQSHLSDVLIKK